MGGIYFFFLQTLRIVRFFFLFFLSFLFFSLVMVGGTHLLSYATSQHLCLWYWSFKYFNFCCRFYPRLLPSCLHLAAWHLPDASVDILTLSVPIKIIWWCLKQPHHVEARSGQAQHSAVCISKHRKGASREVSYFSYDCLHGWLHVCLKEGSAKVCSCFQLLPLV